MAVQYNSENNNWETWIDLFKNKIPKASNEAKDTFVKLKNLLEQGVSVDNWDKWIKTNNLADESLIKFLKDTNYGTKDLSNYQQYLKDTGKATSSFANLTKTAGTAIKSLGAALSSMLIMWGVTKAIELAVTAFDNWIHRVEKAKEAAIDSAKEYSKKVQCQIIDLKLSSII